MVARDELGPGDRAHEAERCSTSSSRTASPTDIIDHFVQYSMLLFQEFGNKVNFWTTFNEPLSFVVYGYNTGLHLPGFHDSPTLVYEVAHNVLLSHAYAVQSSSRTASFSPRRIGIVLNANQFCPLDANTPTMWRLPSAR
jgi:beta-glucosidase/6-phospho-beta-glucosidase/beta-galactosidase